MVQEQIAEIERERDAAPTSCEATAVEVGSCLISVACSRYSRGCSIS